MKSSQKMKLTVQTLKKKNAVMSGHSSSNQLAFIVWYLKNGC